MAAWCAAGGGGSGSHTNLRIAFGALVRRRARHNRLRADYVLESTFASCTPMCSQLSCFCFCAFVFVFLCVGFLAYAGACLRMAFVFGVHVCVCVCMCACVRRHCSAQTGWVHPTSRWSVASCARLPQWAVIASALPTQRAWSTVSLWHASAPDCVGQCVWLCFCACTVFGHPALRATAVDTAVLHCACFLSGCVAIFLGPCPLCWAVV